MFNVGDMVLIKCDLEVGKVYDGITMQSGIMANTRGKVGKVIETYDCNAYKVKTDTSTWNYTGCMLKPTITLKEFKESKTTLGIHCYTKEEAKKLTKKFDEMGMTWKGGDSYLTENWYRVFKKETVYYNNGTCGDLDSAYLNEFEVYEFEQVLDFYETTSQQPLTNSSQEPCDNLATTLQQPFNNLLTTSNVNHPQHYNQGKYERL